MYTYHSNTLSGAQVEQPINGHSFGKELAQESTAEPQTHESVAVVPVKGTSNRGAVGLCQIIVCGGH